MGEDKIPEKYIGSICLLMGSLRAWWEKWKRREGEKKRTARLKESER